MVDVSATGDRKLRVLFWPYRFWLECARPAGAWLAMDRDTDQRLCQTDTWRWRNLPLGM